jgi:hypothetical protein
VDGRLRGVDQAAALQLAQDGHDAAGPVDVLHVHVGLGRRHLGQARHAARQAVDVGHAEVDAAFVRGGQQVQHGVGRAAHGDVQAHGVLERRAGGDAARQGRGVVLLVPALAEVDDHTAGFLEQRLAVGVGGQHRAVAGQDRPRASVRQFIELAVNMPEHEPQVGHAAFSIAVTSSSVYLSSAATTMASTRSSARILPLIRIHLAGLHRPAGDEDHRDVQPHGGHQHAGGDLVAVGDADHGVGAVGVDHVLDAVGDQLAARQRVQHAAVAHGDAVVDRDGVELLGHAAGRLDLAGDQLAQVLQVHVARDELGEAVGHGDDRLAEVLVLHAGGAPQAAGAGHVAAVGGGSRAIGRHGR